MKVNSTEMLKDKKKSFRIKDFIPLKFVYSILLIIIISLIITTLNSMYKVDVQEYKNKVYIKTSEKIVKNIDLIYKEKLDETLYLSNSISKHYNIKKSLLLNIPENLDFNVILNEIKINPIYADARIEIIDRNGNSFKKSWNIKNEDNLNYDRFIKQPKNKTILYASNYGITITNLIPIYNDKVFIGIFVLHSHFDSIIDTLKQQDYETVIILNKKDSQNVYQNRSYTKNFIDGFYIVNSNINLYIQRVIKQNNIESYMQEWDKSYHDLKSFEHLITKYTIKDNDNKNKLQIFIFKSFDKLDLKAIELIEKWYIIFALSVILFAIFIIYYLYASYTISDTNRENSSLIMINDNLKNKTDLLDYNEKKVENLFNSQPNLMIMHNGKEITEANKRFMGFFNRFGTFDGFKKDHKCVSEFFEEYNAPNYIWEQSIEGEYWIDYILKNPRRLYKMVMSIENRQGEQEAHHFIIKLNEMKYAGIVSERLIIIALVDMTQDMKNYKSLEELTKENND